MFYISSIAAQIAVLEGRASSDQPEESCSPAVESQQSSPTSGSSDRNDPALDYLVQGSTEIPPCLTSSFINHNHLYNVPSIN